MTKEILEANLQVKAWNNTFYRKKVFQKLNAIILSY